MQASMDRNRTTFVRVATRARTGFTSRAALATEGEWYDPEDALARKMIDGISTYEDVFAELAESVALPASPSPPRSPPAPEEDDEDETLAAASHEGELIMETPETKPATTPPAPPIVTPPAAAAPADNVVNLDALRTEARGNVLAEMREIAETCQIAGRPELAAEFIGAGKSLADVRKALIDQKAEADRKLGELNNHQPAKANLTKEAMMAGWDTAFARVHGKPAA
jgi:hypothetical protein